MSADPGEALAFVRPDWKAPAHVRAFCTTRAGGVSAAPWDSLNLGLHVGDEAAHVHENRRRLGEALALPSAPSWLVQVHGTRVTGIDAPSAATASPPEADGAWTSSPGVVLAVLTADCLPLVIADEVGTRVAVVHAGWRGLAAGVLGEALAAFTPGATLHVWLGPAIGPGAFEVGAEVREAFVARHPAHARAFVATGAPGKFKADLYALARGELAGLREARTLSVSGGERCTVTESTLFHSHRRDGVHSGRMATLVWID